MTGEAASPSDLGLTLLTGATGRLGRAVMPRLVDLGVHLRCLLLPGDPGKASLKDNNIEVVEGRLETGEGLAEAVDGVACVIHMAALLPGAGTTDKALTDSITIGTSNLLSSVAECDPKPKRFLYVSSSAVYGPQMPPDCNPIREDHPIRPTSVYGAAKAAAEAFVVAYANRGDVQATIVRPADIVEPNDFAIPDGFMARRFRFDANARELFVPVDDEGRSNFMSFLSASETARGLIAALMGDRGVADAFHIGPWQTPADLTIGTELARRWGWTLKTEPTPRPIREWVLDVTKAHASFGFQSKEGIHDIL